MDRGGLKRFASWARTWLREQVRVKARALGLGAKELVEPSFVSGGMSVAGFTFDAHTVGLYRQVRAELDDRMRAGATYADALDALLDEMAFTWFNRFTALRYLEANEYGVRALSHPQEGVTEPALLQGANGLVTAGQLPGVSSDMLQAWQRQGQDATYQGVLNGYCRSLGSWLPFLFNPKLDIAELFLPDRLLAPGTIVRRIVTDVPEEDWREIEVIGWLYQFYISDRKDEVFAKKGTYTARDIPPATQLFTPHWIVRYMVENSVGRLWLESHPDSSLRDHMPYYLDPNDAPHDEAGDQAGDEVAEVAKNLASAPDRSAGTPLQPQDITVMDPACGSGHILVYAFDLLVRIYQEAGYTTRDIPRLILEHNLHGLDIDLRAAQLANFAVTMKARAHSRIVQTNPQPLHILAIEHTRGVTLPDRPHLTKSKWRPLLDAFQHADELGSLITPPEDTNLDELQTELDAFSRTGQLESTSLTPKLQHLLQQTKLLARKYHAVITNPPYMGSKAFSKTLKDFTKANYPRSKADLFAVFMEKSLELTVDGGIMAMINQHNWMFLSSFADLRSDLVDRVQFGSVLHLGPRTFIGLGGEVVQSVAFTAEKRNPRTEQTRFVRLVDYSSADQKRAHAMTAPTYWRNVKSAFGTIPDRMFAYWLSDRAYAVFSHCRPLSSLTRPRTGMRTGDNQRFLRWWHEVCQRRATVPMGSIPERGATWIPYNKGGSARRWFGNLDLVVNWADDGEEIKQNTLDNYPSLSLDNLGWKISNERYYFDEGVTWSAMTSGSPDFRFRPSGSIFDTKGPMLHFSDHRTLFLALGALNSRPVAYLFAALSPTLDVLIRQVAELPLCWATAVDAIPEAVLERVQKLVDLMRTDWDSFEESWNFQEHPLVRQGKARVADAFEAWRVEADEAFFELKRLEEENNRYWIDAYGLQDELDPDVPEDEVTIRRAERDRDVRSLISYAVGCMMGRYTLTKPGLQFAGGEFNLGDFEGPFVPDADGILPITDEPYFEDDIVTRFTSWLEAAFEPDHAQDNLRWLAETLTLRSSESPRERMRRYFLTEFVKDHNRQYSKRPIYWLFTSGKHGGFNALVYLHRYTPDTLARMRNDYALPLDAKLQAAIRDADHQAENASSASVKNRAEKLASKLRAQDEELEAYQEALQHHADQRIPLNLDDGVAYNYTLLAVLLYQGSDLPLDQLLKASQWKRDLLKQEATA